MQPGQSAISFTKPTVVLRVRPPAPVGPCAATNCSAALKATDAECNVVGSGASHVLTSQYFDSCNKAFQGLHADELKYLNKDGQDLTRYQHHKHDTCQLSRIMRESHACGLKTSISRIEDNFSIWTSCSLKCLSPLNRYFQNQLYAH